ncbi:trichohyalin-like isoform X9 [Mytilus trossulus]|uniref:trichohyalin-like isoform X9 n=1 Tax=Mytilus trossulus TaxID=6551 RepID=UPI0030063A29
MSSLEERREARRRRRQQEEELDVKSSVTSPDDPLNEKKQKEREDRLQRIAAGFSTLNGEDELERRRKERREQRLRSGETETPSEDTSSRRNRRRRGTEDDIDTSATEEVTSTRSRRRRGEEEETDSAPVSVPEPEPEQESQPQVNNNAEEEESRRREEEEEAERQRQAAEETRRRQQEEEDRRRREDEERRQREEEEQRKREEESSEETDSESDMDENDKRSRAQQKDHDDHERKIDEQLKRLKSLENENDLLLEEEGWNGTSNGVTSVRKKSDERGKKLSPKEPVRRSLTEYSLRTAEDGKCGKLKSFFEEKVEGHVNGDHNELSRSLNFSKKVTGHTSLEDKSPVHEKWKKFEIKQQTKDLQQETKKDLAAYQAKVISPGASRLKDIQKKFEDKTNTENSRSSLGRLSASESHLNENQSDPQPRPDSWRRRSSAKAEEEERLERERQEAEEREREEAARQMEEQQKKKKGKRKGLGGLSPEKKKMLKKLIMQKAAEDLRNEAKAKAEEKERYINERVGHLNLEGKAEGDLVKLCKQLHQQLSKLEEEVYDWEVKIRKQDQEIITLTLKVNDSKGKFAKPVLKKVNKTESKFKKLTSKTSKDKADFRDNLKSTGQSKFAIDEEEKAE